MLQKSWLGRNLSCLLPGLYKTQLVSVVAQAVEPSVYLKVFILAKHGLAVAGCLETFPKIVKKGHNKNNIFHHVILEKTPLFILLSHIFVYYFSLSTFWFSRAKDLSPSPPWNHHHHPPASEVPKFLPIEQSLAKLCPTNCSSSHGSWVSFSCHGNTRGKFRQVYARPMQNWWIDAFWGSSVGPPWGTKNCKKIYKFQDAEFWDAR